MGLFGPPNVDELQAKRNVKGLIKALGHQKDVKVRLGAAKALEQIGDARAVEPLIAALKDSSWDVRAAAAGALRQIGDARAVEPLIAALKDSSWDVRAAAAGALRQIGDARAVEPLIAVIKDRSNRSDVCAEAAGALGQMGDVRAVEPLVAALKETFYYGRAVGRAVADALDQLGWKHDRDKTGMTGVAYCIAKQQWDECVAIGKPAAEPLIRALWWDQKQAAADALVRIGAPAVESLIVELKDGLTYYGRKTVADILARIGEPAVEPLLTMFKHEDWDLTRAAADALGQIGDARAVEPLITVLDSHYTESFALKPIVGALVRIGAPAVELLIVALEDNSSRNTRTTTDPLYLHGRRHIRQFVARALIDIYTAGQLDATQKQLILAQRDTIQYHDDVSTHEDHPCGHSDGEHDDAGVGIDFPL